MTTAYFSCQWAMASPTTVESNVSFLPEEDPSTHPEVERRGGYDCQFVGEIPKDGQCPECGLVYRSPHQTICCGKRLCEDCVERIKASSKQCPFASCNAAEISSFLDKACVQWLGKYSVNCPNRREGCKWEGQLADLDRHLNLEPTTEKQLTGCPFSRVKCCFCFESFERRFINTHQLTECLKRPYDCEYCGYSASFEEVTQQHSNECPSAPVTCPNNCELVVFRSGLERHRKHDCPLEIQQCEFHAVGCQVELPRRDMPEHERQSVVEHSVALSRTLQKAMAEITTLEKEKAETSSLQEVMKDITSLQDDTTSLQKAIVDITSMKSDTSLQKAMTSLESKKADKTSLQVATAHTKSLQNKVASLQGEMQDCLNAMRDAMKDSQDKMQERITAQGKRVWMGIALLAIVTVVAAMHGGQYSVSGRMNGIQYTNDRTGFCTFDEHENCKVENGRAYTDKEGREVWRNELDRRMEQEQKQRRDELDRRMEQEQKERHDELDRRMEQAQKERRDELDRRMGQAQKERRDELDRRMEQAQKERRDELDRRMEQEQNERCDELDSRMEQEQNERCDELDSRMEQERKERHDELDRRMEEVLLQVSMHDTTERQEKQRLQGQLSELQDQLDQDIKKRQKTDIEHSHEVAGVDVNMLQVRQNAILKHLQMFPHEDILPFEFEMKEFKEKRRNGNLWYSPPFYTDINGYKMCIRVKARGTDGKYISVAVFLMAGVADDVLDWPFREDIKIELINQARSWNPLSYYHSKKENHCKTFKFRLSKSNHRVTTRNRAQDGLQISRFIAHDKLKYNSKEGTQYLKDDTLKFRISASSAY